MAKVKILFRGRLYIKDVGAFEFDKGKILIPKVKDKLHLSVMSEVNRQVMRLQTEMAFLTKVLCSNKTKP